MTYVERPGLQWGRGAWPEPGHVCCPFDPLINRTALILSIYSSLALLEELLVTPYKYYFRRCQNMGAVTNISNVLITLN
jgi:hypothetical protein